MSFLRQGKTGKERSGGAHAISARGKDVKVIVEHKMSFDIS